MSTGRLGEILCTTKINPIMDGYKNTNHGQILVIQPYPLSIKMHQMHSLEFSSLCLQLHSVILEQQVEHYQENYVYLLMRVDPFYILGVEALFNKASLD